MTDQAGIPQAQADEAPDHYAIDQELLSFVDSKFGEPVQYVIAVNSKAQMLLFVRNGLSVTDFEEHELPLAYRSLAGSDIIKNKTTVISVTENAHLIIPGECDKTAGRRCCRGHNVRGFKDLYPNE